jgi:two-component system chemotaxis response regulator CheY
MHALIVEDAFTSRALLYRYLSGLAEVDAVEDGENALVAFRMALEARRPYDLVCLDIGLPKVDGEEVLRSIRRIEEERGVVRQTRVIMLTGRGDGRTIMRSFFSGCEGYLVKPFQRGDLMNLLDKQGLLVPGRVS